MYHSKEVDILLIEDNPNDVELTTRALKKHNLANNMIVIQDGEEAVEYLFATGRYQDRGIDNTPKVILLDLKLPKVTGLEILELLKKNDKTKTIPVVVLTSSKEERDIVESYRLGVNSYIVKPVDFEKFLESVRQIGYYWLLLNQKPEK